MRADRIEAVTHRLRKPLQGRLGRISIRSREQRVDRTAVHAQLRSVDLVTSRTILA